MEGRIKKLSKLIFLALIAIGIGWRIYYYITARSLWLDEAMLASSVVTKSFASLVSEALDWQQSASLGWLLIVKVITVFAGTSEQSLRLISLLSGIGCIVLFYLMCKRVLELKWPLFYTAVFSVLPYYVYYSNEFKPYIFDDMVVLLSLLILGLYKRKRMSFNKLILCYSILIWFSIYGIIAIGSCMAIVVAETVYGCARDKRINRGDIIKACKCAIVLASLITYYFIWLSSTTQGATGNGYWALLRFPIIPSSFSEMKLMARMLLQLLAPIPGGNKIKAVFVMLGAVAAVAVFLKDRGNYILWSCAAMLLMMLAASGIGFLPMQDRLVQFWLIPAIMLEAEGFEVCEGALASKACSGDCRLPGKVLGILLRIEPVLLIAVALFFTCCGFVSLNPYKSNSEVSEAVDYLESNLGEEDYVFVYGYSIPVYEYEMGYPLPYASIGYYEDLPQEDGNVIYGSLMKLYLYEEPYSYEYEVDMDAVEENASLIMQHGSVYIFTSHAGADDEDIKELLSMLGGHGEIETVVNSHETYMYRWTASP